jgi:hypothetical protein
MTHDKMIKRMYEEHGVYPLPEVQEYALDLQTERRLEGYAEYETTVGGGAQLAKLTQNNTRPIRILPNFDLLYEDKVKPNRLCFSNGAWYKRGDPTIAQPTNETDFTCSRSWDSTTSQYVTKQGVEDQNCWAVCGPEDTLTISNRKW